MLLFGHRFIDSPRFYHIDSVDAISRTPSNSMLYIDFSERNLDIVDHLNLNNLVFGLLCKSLTEAIYANALQANYIVVDPDIATAVQKAADHYLFDAKILVRTEDESAIASFAEDGVDGLLFPEGVIKISG